MKRYILFTVVECVVLSLANAQAVQRQAAISGGGSPDQGRCTIEVVVDDVAQVEIRGATATLRTVSGQPAQWRRFECTSVMPANLNNFSFQGADGRGRQTLVRDPRQGGVAVIEIDDKEGGAGNYAFEIMWDSRGNGGNQSNNPGTVPPPVYRENGSRPGYRTDPNQPGYRPDSNQPGYRNDSNQPGYRNDPNQPGYRNDPNQPGYRNDPNQPGYGRDDRRNDAYGNGGQGGYRPDYRNSEYYRRYGHGFGADEAVRMCQQLVATQATRRFGRAEVHFHQTRMDQNPGRGDWVTGTLDVHRGSQRSAMYNFACSVNFDNGQVRTVQLDSRPTQSEW